jgi:hypothetical protein
MTLILSGTDGLSDVDGTAATPALRGTDANTGIFFPAADTIAFAEGGAEAMRIDSSGNVGIGTTSIGSKLDVRGGNTLVSAQYGVANINSTDTFAINKGGSLSFGGKYATDGSVQTFAAIAGRKEDAGDGGWAGYLQFVTGTTPTERMRIDSSGNVGIGVTPTSAFQVAKESVIAKLKSTSDNSTYLQIEANNGAGSQFYVGQDSSTGGSFGKGAYAAVVWQVGARPLIFATSNSEAARIDSSGNVGIGSTTVIGKFQVTVGDITPSTSGNMNGFVISKDNNGNGLSMGTSDTGGYNWISSAYTNGGGSGRPLRIIPGTNGVQLATGGTSWTSLSDERYKTDLTPILNASDKVALLRSVTGRFKTDEVGTSRAFLIAQDVQTAFPEAVDSSDLERLGVQYTEVIPLLVAAIKEQQALITALTTRITALEAA